MAEWCYTLIENFQEERVLIELLKVFLSLESHEESVRVIFIVYITDTTCESKKEQIKPGFINIHRDFLSRI